MQLPLQIVFRNMEPSPAIEAKVRERADKLERFAERIMSCRVAVEERHRHHRQGNLFHVRIDVKLPGTEIVANREPAEHHAHEDVYVAIRDAFDAVQRQLEDHVRLRRGDVKTHEPMLHGRVIEHYSDYGKIETPDGRIVYFHKNSVVDGHFEDLGVGSEVRFVEETGELGPQASTVHVIGKHHVVG